MNKKIVKICLFDKNSTPSQVLGFNGDYILDNICIQAETTESLDGTYELDATFIVDSEGLYKQIHDEAILKVQMDYGEEVFRIVKLNERSRDIIVFARQITISETLDMWIEDIRPTQTSGLSALNNLKNGSIGKKDINVFSDITTTATAYYQRMSMYKAIHDCDQSFLNRWGGEVQRRCYNLTINKRIGSDRGVQIRSRKNLTGFEAETNIDNVVTRVRPIGFDGIEAGSFVDSPLINNYSAIKTKEIKYEDVKLKDENNPDEGFNTLQEAQVELIRLAKLEFSENHIDELRADYLINFVYLEQTEEYKDYIQAERVYIGDTVHVYEEKHDINVSVRAITRKYDVLRQKVIEIELSNTDISQKTITTSDILAELNSIISKTENNNVSDIIQSMINSGIKDSYVIPRQNEIIVADNKDINLANNVIRINKNGLAFSKTGYYGDYEYGFTIDGVINASLIATGILSTILIQNADGSLQIDLGSTKGIMTRKNGKNAIELAGTILKFYDWEGEGENVGQIHSTRYNDIEGKTGIVVGNTKNSFVGLGYETGENDNIFKFYLMCDKDNITGEANVPIVVWQDIELKGHELWLKYGIDSIYTSTSDNFINKVKNIFYVIDRDTGNERMSVDKNEFNLCEANNEAKRYCKISPSETFFGSNGQKYFSNVPGALRLYNPNNNNDFYCQISPDETFFGSNDAKYFSCHPNGFSFWKGTQDILYTSTNDMLVSSFSTYIDGDFTVTGNKNCVQITENYGERLFYSVEDCESYLTDRSMELFTVERTAEGTYERVILLDNIYKESINLELGYTVEVIKQGWGDYRIKEQTKDYFIVESDRMDFTFKYIVTGKRKGFEEQRNNELFKGVKSETPIQSEFWRLYSNAAVKGSDINEKAL